MRRVDNVPWYLQPFFMLFGYSMGLFFYCYSWLLHLTCKIVFTGAPMPLSNGAVYCIWHKSLLFYFIVFPKVKRHAWMNHPAWYMKPVHVLLRLTGVDYICLGSSGNSGKAALEGVTGHLKHGYSTVVAADGPAGPPQQLKPGVLFMSRDAQIPVVALHFSCTRSIRLRGWDRKIAPGLFSTITVDVGQPVYVTDANFEEAAETVKIHLDK